MADEKGANSERCDVKNIERNDDVEDGALRHRSNEKEMRATAGCRDKHAELILPWALGFIELVRSGVLNPAQCLHGPP